MGREGQGSARDKDSQEPRALSLHRTKAGELSDSEEKDKYLKALRKAKDAMIDMRLGYGSQAMSYLLVDWKNRHPEAYEAFREELGR